MIDYPPILCAYLVDAQFNIVAACPNTVAWARQIGQTDIFGKKPSRVFNEFSGESAMRQYALVLETGTAQQSTDDSMIDGAPVTTVTRRIPMLKDGNDIQILTLVHNITRQSELDKTVQQSEKLESLGVLAGGLAHEFNNLLGGIFGNVNMARKHAGPVNPKVMQYLDRAMTSFERATHLTHQLLTFSKSGAPVKKPISLRPLCHEAMELALAGSTMQSRLDFQENLPGIYADGNQIRQVLTNLLFNARQAMPVGGMVTIKAEVKNVDAGDSALKPGRYVKVSIADNGPGIGTDILHRVFDPFFTTRNTGSGLGLATAHSIVTQHGGTISIDSSAESGTLVTFYVEVASEGVADTVTFPVRRHIPAKRVLLLEDDSLLQEVTAELLQIMGWEVEVVDTGTAAVARFSEAMTQGTPFGIVIFDLTIEGEMGGQAAMAQLIKSYPHICGIVASGYEDSPVLAAPEKYGFCAKLVKPFQPDELRNVLNQVMRQANIGFDTGFDE